VTRVSAGQPAVVDGIRFAGLSLGYFSLRYEIEAPGTPPRPAEPGSLGVESRPLKGTKRKIPCGGP